MTDGVWVWTVRDVVMLGVCALAGIAALGWLAYIAGVVVWSSARAWWRRR